MTACGISAICTRRTGPTSTAGVWPIAIAPAGRPDPGRIIAFVFGEKQAMLDVVRLMRPDQMEPSSEGASSRAFATFEARGGERGLCDPRRAGAAIDAIDHLRIIYALTTLTTTQVMDRRSSCAC